MNWFETLFGFREGPYHWTQQQLDLDGHTLVSRANGRRFDVGHFSTPSVAALRDRVAGLCPGTLRLRHEAVSDIFAAHAAPENAGAVFQAASQLNCLEFAAPTVVPERGVTIYAGDPTQGPACALAAAAATVFRNYFAEVDGIAGQTTDRQLNNLAGVQQLLGAAGDLVEVRNGYTFSDDARLERLNAVLEKADRAQLVGAVRVGLHAGVGVTFSERYVPATRPQTVSQVYASALSCGYSAGSLDQWAPLATVALDGAYEATLLAAAGCAQEQAPAWCGSPCSAGVYLAIETPGSPTRSDGPSRRPGTTHSTCAWPTTAGWMLGWLPRSTKRWSATSARRASAGRLDVCSPAARTHSLERS